MVEDATHKLKLGYINAFGASFSTKEHTLKNSIIFLDEPKIIYPIGHHIAIRDIDDNTSKSNISKMNFIMMPENVKQITCMKLSPNKRFLLVAEQHKNDASCFISVYDLKEALLVAQKVHNITELSEGRGNIYINGQSVNQHSNNNQSANSALSGAANQAAAASTGMSASANATGGAQSKGGAAGQNGAKENAKPKIIVDFNFSSTSNHQICIAMTDEVDSKVVVFDWNNARVIACAEWKRQHIDRVTFNPSDETREICVSGHNIWALFSIKDGVKDGILNPTNKNFCELISKARRHIAFSANAKTVFTEHCWLDRNRLLGCTMTGEMYFFEDYTLRRVHDNGNAFQSEENQSYVVSIKTFSKGFFLGSNEGEMAMWIRQEENQSTSGKSAYDFIARWQPPATKRQQILGMALNSNEETLAVAMQNNNIGIVNTKSIWQSDIMNNEVKFELVCRGFHNGSITGLDVAIQRPIIATCSRDDSTIRLWNYMTGQCELAREYFVLEDKAVRNQAKPLISIAMHPSGYQLAASFIDKIQIHHILHDGLRKLKSIELRNAYLIKYSKGGQYFFAVEKSSIYIYNAYTFVELHKIIVHTPKIFSLVFADLDRAFAVVGAGGFIGRWKLPSFEEICWSDAENPRPSQTTTWTDFKAVDFVKEPKEITSAGAAENQPLQLGVAGTDDASRQRLMVVNQDNSVIKDWNYIHDPEELGMLTQTQFLRLNKRNLQGFAMGNNLGEVKTILHPYQAKGVNRALSHKGTVTRLLSTQDSRFLFSAGEDGTLFIYEVGEEKNPEPGEVVTEKQVRAMATEQANKIYKFEENDAGNNKIKPIMDPELANIVLVKKEEMEEWLEKQKKLKAELDATKRKVQAKLAEYKRGYSEQEEASRRQKDDDIRDLKQRYDDLDMQKRLQTVQNEEAMDKIAKYHYEEVKEIERLFEKKLKQEGDGYLQLEQEGLEMKQRYEKQIEQIKKENQEAIEGLLEEFKVNLRKVHVEYKESKEFATKLGDYYQKKLEKQEDTHEKEVMDLTLQHHDEVEAKMKEVQDKQIKLQKKERLQRDAAAEKEKVQQNFEDAQAALEAERAKIQKLQQDIEQKELSKNEEIDKLYKRETDLYKYKFKIKDLKKSRHVLTHRAKEMQQSLQPKEEQIDNLKDQLLKLEEDFEDQSATLQDHATSLRKMQSKIDQIGVEIADQEDRTKEKKAIILKFQQDVQKIVDTKNENEYLTGLMKLNQDYVKSDMAYRDQGKKRDADQIEEFYARMMQMDRTISQLCKNKEKTDMRIRTDGKLRTKQNTRLIVWFNTLTYENQKQTVVLQKKKLEQEGLQGTLNELKRKEKEVRRQYNKVVANQHRASSSRASSAVPRGPRDNSEEMLDRSASETGQQRAHSRQGGHASSAVKLSSGADIQKEEEQDKQKIETLKRQIEVNNSEIINNWEQIAMIKRKIVQAWQMKQQNVDPALANQFFNNN